MQVLQKAIRRGLIPLHKKVGGIRQRLRAEREVSLAFGKGAAPPILVYQMGKVGSSTVCSTLEGAHLPNHVLHLHFLSDNLPKLVNQHIEAGLCPYHLALGLAVRRRISKIDRLNCKIISLVRDPVARNISDVFQVPRLIGADVQDASGAFEVARTLEFLERRLSSLEAFEYTFDWFDSEIKAVFGVDVFAEPFDKERGGQIYRKNGVEVLVLRLEDLSEIGPPVLASFVGLPEPLPMRQDNVTHDKRSGDVYRAVKERLRLSRSLCERVYASRYVRHFYSDAMIDAFLRKWSREEAQPYGSLAGR